jgi:hypothetical protein
MIMTLARAMKTDNILTTTSSARYSTKAATARPFSATG